MILAHHQSVSDNSDLPKHLHILILAQTLVDTTHGGVSCGTLSGNCACHVTMTQTLNTTDIHQDTGHIQEFMAMTNELQQTRNIANRGHGPPRMAPDAALSELRRKAVPC